MLACCMNGMHVVHIHIYLHFDSKAGQPVIILAFSFIDAKRRSLFF